MSLLPKVSQVSHLVMGCCLKRVSVLNAKTEKELKQSKDIWCQNILHDFSHESARRYCASAFHNSHFLLLSSSSSFFFFFQSVVVYFSTVNSVRVHYLRDLQTSLFSNFFIKNGSHSIIYTFKNYFATVFLVFSKIICIQMDQLHNFSHKSGWRYCAFAFHNSRFLLLSSSSSSSSFLAVVVDFSTVNSVRVHYLRDP